VSGPALFAAICAVAVPAWWIALYQSAAVRQMFVPDPAWPAFRGLLVPDLLLTTFTALLAVRLKRNRPSVMLAGLVCGAWAYATLYTIAWARLAGAPLAGPLLMTTALAGFVAITYALSPRSSRTR
jgi:hypothetical protein